MRALPRATATTSSTVSDARPIEIASRVASAEPWRSGVAIERVGGRSSLAVFARVVVDAHHLHVASVARHGEHDAALALVLVLDAVAAVAAEVVRIERLARGIAGLSGRRAQDLLHLLGRHVVLDLRELAARRRCRALDRLALGGCGLLFGLRGRRSRVGGTAAEQYARAQRERRREHSR